MTRPPSTLSSPSPTHPVLFFLFLLTTGVHPSSSYLMLTFPFPTSSATSPHSAILTSPSLSVPDPLYTNTLLVRYSCHKEGGAVLSDLDVAGCMYLPTKIPIETFNLSFESKRNMQHFNGKITGSEEREKKLWRS